MSIIETAKEALHLGGNGHELKRVEYPFLTKCDRCGKVTECRRVVSEKPLEPMYVCKVHSVDAHLPKPKQLFPLRIEL